MEPKNGVCSECGNQLVWVKNQLICDSCGIINESFILFEGQKYYNIAIPIQECIGYTPIEPGIEKIIPHKHILNLTKEQSKYNETLFWYKLIISKIRDFMPPYKHQFRKDYYTQLSIIRKKLKRNYIPNYLIAIVIIKYQLNKKITEFEPFIAEKDRNLFERLKRYEENKYELDIHTPQEVIQRIKKVQKYILIKTRFSLKPKIIGFLTGLINPTTKKEKNIRNLYRHKLKKLGIAIQTLQRIQ